MQQEFLNFIQHKLQLPANSKVLLAVSGGVDSMVMLHLFAKTNFELGVAHCNFKLRNTESDGDHQFVCEAAKEMNVKFHEIKFDTLEYSNLYKVSTQMAARTLRYQWFEQLLKEHHYDAIAIAHQQTDVLETLLINQLRGTGIGGMHGIKGKNNFLIRPLLFATRDEITNYAIENKLTWREDSSNAHDSYLRNKIRLHILPVLKEINPSVEKTFAANAEKFNNAEQLIESVLPQLRLQFVRFDGTILLIDLIKLKLHTAPKAVLYYLLRDYNFKNNLIDEIYEAFEMEPGKIFYSSTHQLLKDRSQLIIQPLEVTANNGFFLIEGEGAVEVGNLQLLLKIMPVQSVNDNYKATGATAYFDADKMEFPLTIRSWQHGDFFYPTGMKGKKKLSDFFIDNKIPVFEKQHIQLLLQQEKIVWVIGKRVDERFKVTNTTQHVLKIEVNDISQWNPIGQ